MIEIKDIKKKFNDKEVLKGINFQFETGKVNLIIGASGGGKSVLSKCMVGLVKPDSGQVLYDGVDFITANIKKQRETRKNIGMLFQASALFDSQTVIENVSFPLQMFTNWTDAQIEKRAKECLERVNLLNADNLLPSEISGGMKKRVGIARAIALNPKYLYCDEPNSGLDPQTSVIIDNLIKDITEDYNITTIVITHDMNTVLNIGDNIMFLFKGKKEWEGNRHEVLDAEDKAFNDFVFASESAQMLKKIKNKEIE